MPPLFSSSQLTSPVSLSAPPWHLQLRSEQQIFAILGSLRLPHSVHPVGENWAQDEYYTPLVLCSLYSWTIEGCRGNFMFPYTGANTRSELLMQPLLPLLTVYSLALREVPKALPCSPRSPASARSPPSALGLIPYFTVRAEVLGPDLCQLPVSFQPLPYLNPHASFLLCSLRGHKVPSPAWSPFLLPLHLANSSLLFWNISGGHSFQERSIRLAPSWVRGQLALTPQSFLGIAV